MINRFKSYYALLSLLWLAIVLCLASYSINTLFIKGKIQFDILALLPEGKTANMKAVTAFMDDTQFSRRILILIGSKDSQNAQLALQHLQQAVIANSLPIQEQNALHIAEDYKQLFTDLYPYRAGLLAKADRQQLKNDQQQALLQRALVEATSPFSSFRSSQLVSDPFSLYPHFVTSFLPTLAIQRDANGQLFTVVDGITWYLYQAQITQPVFSLKLQEKLVAELSGILQDPALQQVKVLKTGALFYAAAGASQAQHEIARIGLISTAGIILMMLVIFRTFSPILFAVTVVTSGLISGLAACLYFFGSIHILSLLFGCSLIGVAVDYALYYFCASYLPQVSHDRFRILNTLMPALPLAVLASVTGYGLLIATPFPGIQQMAILACVGLVCTFISVCLWGPYFIWQTADQKNTTYLRALHLQSYLGKFAAWGRKKSYRWGLVILLLAIFGMGVAKLRFEDNVRSFQALDTALKTQEDQIKSITHLDSSAQFLEVKGDNVEKMLQQQEKLVDDLDRLQVNYKAIVDLIPSQQRQQENRSLVEQLYQQHYDAFMQALGVNKVFNATNLGLHQPLLVLSDIKNLPTGWRELVHYSDDGVVGRIMLLRPVNSLKNMNFIDPVREYSQLFASYREVIMTLVLAVLVGFTVLLSFSKGIKVAVSIISPVLLSILASTGIIGLLGPFTLFHAMGFMLVLCIGIDYALFLYWRGKTSQGNLRLLGNGLAATTTILSFGLLALSQTTAVHNFGLAVFSGIALCFLVTTFFLGQYDRQDYQI